MLSPLAAPPLEPQILVGAALSPPPLGGEMRAADPELRSVGAGAGRRAPRQKPGLRLVSAGSDARVRGCAAGGGGGAKVCSGPEAEVWPLKLRLLSPRVSSTHYPHTPPRPPRFGCGDLTRSRGGRVFSTAGRRSPLHNCSWFPLSISASLLLVLIHTAGPRVCPPRVVRPLSRPCPLFC